jgi:hypothetical protein
MSEIPFEQKGRAPASSRGDRALIGLGIAALGILAAALWSQAGREVFASAMAGLWALCF